MSEVCENCSNPIGKLEQALLFDEHVVCRACYARLCDDADASADPVILGITARLAPKPDKRGGMLDKVEFIAVQRIKLVTFDPDTKVLASEIIEVPNDFKPADVIRATEESMGLRVRKLRILERKWTETHKMTGLMKGLLAVTVYETLAR